MWLRDFVKSFSKEEGSTMSREVQSEEMYKGAQRESFCGITTKSYEGVVDTAAEGGLVGTLALSRLEAALTQRGLKCKWIPKQSSAKGVGGLARVVGVVWIPIGIAGVNGILECTVVEGEVPLLLPIQLLKQLKVVLNFRDYTFVMSEHQLSIEMHELPSGHVTIEVLQYHPNGFSLPDDVPGMTMSDFVTQCFVGAMSAQLIETLKEEDACPSRRSTSPQCHGVHRRPPAAAERPLFDWPRKEQGKGDQSGDQSQEGLARVANDPGQDLHFDHVHSPPIRRAGMVSRIAVGIAAAALGTGGGDLGRHLCSPHRVGQEAGAFEEQRESQGGCQQLHPPQGEFEGRWKPFELVHHVPNVSLPMGEHDEVIGDQEQSQRGQEDAEEGPLESGRRDRLVRVQPSQDNDQSQGASGSIIVGEAGGAHEEGDRGTENRNPAEEHPVPGFANSPSEDGVREGQGLRVCQDEGGGDDDPSQSGQANLRLWTGGRAPSHEEGELETRPEVLDMCRGGLRLLPVAPERGRSGCDVGGVIQLADTSGAESEIQEPKDKSVRAQEDTGSDRGGQRWRAVKDSTGGWMSTSSLRGRRWLRRHQEVPTNLQKLFKLEEDYEAWDPATGEWLERKGPVKETEESMIRVWATYGDRLAMEEVEGQDKVKSLSRRSRRSLTQDMEKAMRTAVVSEVYSPPRMGPIAEQKGMEAGTAFDQKTGWDLRDPAQARKMWQTLQREDPELVVLCPPCVAFSPMQNINYPQMKQVMVIHLIAEGLHHLQVSMLIAKWQWRRGKRFLFERPRNAKSWDEEEVKEVSRLEGVMMVNCDMCMFGLRVRHGLNKKPTRLMTNCEEIAREMHRECDHSHFHEPLEGGGLTRKAQEYTTEFCEAVMRGLRRALRGNECYMEEDFMEEEGDDDEVEDVLERQLHVPDEVSKEPRPGEDAPNYEPTPHEKQMVLKLHRGVGHPQVKELVRLMRAARVRGEIVRWAAKHFKCEACASNPRPKAVRPVSIPRTYQPCKVIGMDLIFIPEIGGGRAFPALSIVDWGTNYQMVEKVEDKTPERIWSMLWNTWIRVFGLPEVLVVDAGKEFSSRLMTLAASCGIVTHQIAARAPWQQGKTEGHGAHYKDLLEKARMEAVVSSEEELKRLMQEVEMVKNRFSNRSGYSPVQRQIGQWPRVCDHSITDELVDTSLMEAAVVDDMERQLEFRRVAQTAFVEHNAREAVKKAFKARSRPPQEFTAGDYVFVYRVPHQRKRKVGGPDYIDRATAKPYWVGPGTVISIEGASLWISVFGELWKAAREQCRLATNVEKQAIEVIMQDCKELVEEYRKRSNRAGYKDLTKEPWPDEEEKPEEEAQGTKRPRNPPEEDGPNDEGERGSRRRVEERGHEEEDARHSEEEGSYTPTEPREREDVQEVPPRPSSRTSDEPEAEAEHEGRREMDEEAQEEREVVRPAGMNPEEIQEHYRRSIAQADRLDDVPPYGQPIRWRSNQRGQARNPYFQEMYMVTPEEEEDDQERRYQLLTDEISPSKKQDYWQFERGGKLLRRYHVRKRKTKFDPSKSKDLPCSLREISLKRRTVKVKEGFIAEEEEEVWTTPTEGPSTIWWKGYTEFEIKESLEEERKPQAEKMIRCWTAERRRPEEVNLKLEDDEAKKEWRKADRAEWDKIVQSGAVKVFDLVDSLKIREDLKRRGKLDRILPSRMLRKYKHAEQPGEAPTKKSRLCIRGDKDQTC